MEGLFFSRGTRVWPWNRNRPGFESRFSPPGKARIGAGFGFFLGPAVRLWSCGPARPFLELVFLGSRFDFGRQPVGFWRQGFFFHERQQIFLRPSSGWTKALFFLPTRVLV